MKIKNKKIQQVANGFIKYLEDSGQINQLAELTRILQKQNWAKANQDEAQIVSCVKLNQAEQKTIEDYLTGNYKSNIKIKYQIDKNILGGLIIKVGNKIIDASLKHRLEKLRETLTYA
ncbi:ATP synthase F1 subunit delta [Patescibacteria group bacterium]|nr:ATP synthase F1 subunit delta [Patescibacteria group bacterium]MBU1885297.1 ATP synthase F1 subunit delta [Patescibacteria group bacterium]